MAADSIAILRRVPQVFLATWLLSLALVQPATAWNALGHKVVCSIAWERLDEATRDEIYRCLQAHPRFAEDFAPDLPEKEPGAWVFQHAGTWPDIARGIKGPDRSKFDHPTWHYINQPVTLGFFSPPAVNLASDPKRSKASTWNVAQATNYCIAVIRSDAPAAQKGLAYSWLFHLVADAHQPMHSSALFCERFPNGDRGGNSIPLKQGRNLHSLWDNLLGRAHQPNDVRRVVVKLKGRAELWHPAATAGIDTWIAESHQLAESFAYSPEIIAAVKQPGELEPIVVPREYLQRAGFQAQGRIVAAGLRLAVLLNHQRAPADSVGADFGNHLVDDAPRVAPAERQDRPQAEPSAQPAATALDHWLTGNSGVRHNSGCRWYQKSKGRACTAEDGKPCGICGG